ncbi:hypothetical protein TWF481_003202 [Arthrobotrys musiformis]|uniref:Uncharacterized protein n=1 Tax=Arthrobotrys musiformis TaxID=47236 RepID=A0AAV9VVW3_9PEZI
MSSINASEYVLLDNAENATLTPLQTTPSLSPALLPILTSSAPAATTSNAATQSSTSPPTGLQSYESFARDLELRRVEWYLEATLLSKLTGDETSERTNSEKARALLSQIYPSQNSSSIFSIRVTRYFLKHSQYEWARGVLNGVTIGTNQKELPGVLEREDRIAYWYYKTISILESRTISENSGIEEAVKNGMIEAVGCSDEEVRKKWINVGYFLMSVYSLIKCDEIDARFWKNQLPVGYTLPDGIHTSHFQLFANLSLAQLPTNTNSTQSVETQRDVSQLESLTTTDILMRDVARLKRDINEIHDTVWMNHKEMSERIKSIHKILDGSENVGGEDLKEVKRRMTYLEGMLLRG